MEFHQTNNNAGDVVNTREHAIGSTCFVGRARAGKDTACEFFASITGLTNAGTVSKYIAPYVAKIDGVPVEDAYARRGESMETRSRWRKIGDDLRANDPAFLVREMMKHGEVGGGIRGRAEIQAARKGNLADLFVWVESNRAWADATCEFGPEECDLIIQNNGTIEEFQERLSRLARFAGFV
jgi:hypothetical protein